jgi:hypothetical protein
MYPLEPYWLGVGIWLLGFILHLYGAHWRYSYRIARIGAVLCWIGLAGTACPLLADNPIPAFTWPTAFDLQNPTTEQIYAVIWIAWFAGFGILIASWLRIVPGYIGWAGFTIGMSATVASWTEDRQLQAVIAIVSVLLVVLLLASKTSSSKRATRPGDYEAELLRLCYGDTSLASRLIKHELKHRPDFSRQAAAMAASTRLRHDRR